MLNFASFTASVVSTTRQSLLRQSQPNEVLLVALVGTLCVGEEQVACGDRGDPRSDLLEFTGVQWDLMGFNGKNQL